MNIAIVGTGAMGSIYAALFAEAGHKVWAIDIWQDHVDAINEVGLRLSGTSGDRVVNGIIAINDLLLAGPCELYIVATKGAGVEAAARAIAKVKPIDAMVLSIQNGLGAGDRITQFLNSEAILLGVADGFGASICGPGHAHHDAMKLIRLGELNGGASLRLSWLEDLWISAGFNAQAFDDIHQLIWEKFICNVALSGPCTVFDCAIGELLENPEWRLVAFGCLREAFLAGQAEGIKFSFSDPVAYLKNFVAMMPAASPSMRQDHAAKRRSEIDSINGMVPVVSKRHGLQSPYNTAISARVRRTEEQF